MEYVLETNGLCKRYRDFTALNGLNMHIPKGSIYGFVGRNGAGKTTLIRLICGLQEPTSGNFILYGAKNTDTKIERARRRMGAVVESPAVYPDMTAEENLRQQYLVLGMPSADGIAELLHLVGLDGTGKKKVKNFSLGMRQRLGIAVVLAGNPDFLVLDEPVNGLDPQGIIEMRRKRQTSPRIKGRHLKESFCSPRWRSSIIAAYSILSGHLREAAFQSMLHQFRSDPARFAEPTADNDTDQGRSPSPFPSGCRSRRWPVRHRAYWQRANFSAPSQMV